MPRTATILVTKTDGSVVDWKVTDEQADDFIKSLLKSTTARAPYSRENSATWKRRGPKPAIPVEGELLEQALSMRENGSSREEIARELKVPSRTLGRAFDRYDQGLPC